MPATDFPASALSVSRPLPKKVRAPHDNPKYAVAVVVEHGSSGSGVAAPIASKILKTAVELGL